MAESERPKVPTPDEAERRWLAGRLNAHERELGELRGRVDQLEHALLELRAAQQDPR